MLTSCDFELTVQKVDMLQERGVTCKLHTGWFIKYAPGELIDHSFLVDIKLNQHQPQGNNYNSNGHLMQHLYGANAVPLLPREVDTAL